jgi:hypothetical protein
MKERPSQDDGILLDVVSDGDELFPDHNKDEIPARLKFNTNRQFHVFMDEMLEYDPPGQENSDYINQLLTGFSFRQAMDRTRPPSPAYFGRPVQDCECSAYLVPAIKLFNRLCFSY